MRQVWKPNVTVAAIIERDGRYLLVEEETRDGLKLNQPAGHLEPGETPVQGVVREALEETARIFEPTALLGIYMSRFTPTSAAGSGGSFRPSSDAPGSPQSEAVTYLRLAFVGSAGEPVADRILDTGIVRTLWMSLDEVRASVDRHRSPLLLRCVEDHASGKPTVSLDSIHVDPSAIYPR